MSQRGKTRQNEKPTIPEFFKGKSVFITGATGFMGKALVEKLLRSCPDIKTVYILMRPKHGKGLEQRLEELMSLSVFDRVKRENAKFREKLVALKGDVMEPRLGLSEEDEETLKNEVFVIFHNAACVRFDDPLKSAVQMNLLGTLELIKIAKEMKNLESFVHVSTAYSNTHKKVIEERIYPAPANWRTIVKLSESMDPEILKVFTPKILGYYPNTYTFTKALTEHAIYDHRDVIPAVILRPTIVVPSLAEPMPGWLDNFNGPIGILVGGGKGIVKCGLSDANVRCDFVMLDVVIKAMIVVAWDRATNPVIHNKELPVYNCSSNGLIRFTVADVHDLAENMCPLVPFENALWKPSATATTSKVYFMICVFFFQLIPALIVDSLLKLSKKRPLLIKLQRRIFVANIALQYFAMNEWLFKNDGLVSLQTRLLKEDIPAFLYYLDSADMLEYMTNCCLGVKQHLLNESTTDLSKAKKQFNRLYWIDKVTKLIALLLFAYMSVRWKMIQSLSYFLRNLYFLK